MNKNYEGGPVEGGPEGGRKSLFGERAPRGLSYGAAVTSKGSRQLVRDIRRSAAQILRVTNPMDPLGSYWFWVLGLVRVTVLVGMILGQEVA